MKYKKLNKSVSSMDSIFFHPLIVFMDISENFEIETEWMKWKKKMIILCVPIHWLTYKSGNVPSETADPSLWWLAALPPWSGHWIAPRPPRWRRRCRCCWSPRRSSWRGWWWPWRRRGRGRGHCRYGTRRAHYPPWSLSQPRRTAGPVFQIWQIIFLTFVLPCLIVVQNMFFRTNGFFMLCVKSRVTFLLSNEILFPFHTVLLPRKHHILQKYSEHADCTLCKYDSNQINLYWAYSKISQIFHIH